MSEIKGISEVASAAGTPPETPHDANARLDWLLANCVESEDGEFTFPDGTSFPCRSTATPDEFGRVRAAFDAMDAARVALGKAVGAMRSREAEWESSFELYHSAIMRGQKLWRAERPDERELTSPDTGFLVAWLLDLVSRAEQRDAPPSLPSAVDQERLRGTGKCPTCGGTGKVADGYGQGGGGDWQCADCLPSRRDRELIGEATERAYAAQDEHPELAALIARLAHALALRVERSDTPKDHSPDSLRTALTAAQQERDELLRRERSLRKLVTLVESSESRRIEERDVAEAALAASESRVAGLRDAVMFAIDILADTSDDKAREAFALLRNTLWPLAEGDLTTPPLAITADEREALGKLRAEVDAAGEVSAAIARKWGLDDERTSTGLRHENDERIEKILARLASISPRPWVTDERHPQFVYCDDALGSAVCDTFLKYTANIPAPTCLANAAFIANAPQDIEWLIGELAAGRSERCRSKFHELRCDLPTGHDGAHIHDRKDGSPKATWHEGRRSPAGCAPIATPSITCGCDCGCVDITYAADRICAACSRGDHIAAAGASRSGGANG